MFSSKSIRISLSNYFDFLSSYLCAQLRCYSSAAVYSCTGISLSFFLLALLCLTPLNYFHICIYGNSTAVHSTPEVSARTHDARRYPSQYSSPVCLGDTYRVCVLMYVHAFLLFVFRIIPSYSSIFSVK